MYHKNIGLKFQHRGQHLTNRAFYSSKTLHKKATFTAEINLCLLFNLPMDFVILVCKSWHLHSFVILHSQAVSMSVSWFSNAA